MSRSPKSAAPRPGGSRRGAAARGEGEPSTEQERKRSRPPPGRERGPTGAHRTTQGEHPTRSGKVAIFGRPNVGKSTMLNVALEQPLAIVSPTPQTTRDVLLGIVRRGAVEIGLLDTPGLHKPKTELGRVMNENAREAARAADAIVFVTDVPKSGELEPRVHPGDAAIAADLPDGVPVVLVVNKVDRAKPRDALLPMLAAYAKLRPWAAVVPIAAKRRDGVDRVLDELAKLMPEGPFAHDEEELTDRPMRFFAAEYVREQILRATEAEVPHAAAVTIERYAESPSGDLILIDATIHVERAGQKKILVGHAAEMLKTIGTRARERIEELTGRRVYLKLWVRTTPAWRDSRQQLADLGYGVKGGRSS